MAIGCYENLGEHTQTIRKGKAHKPTEFGRLVRIDEVENGVVSNDEVQDGNPADAQAWMPAPFCNTSASCSRGERA